MRIAPNTDCEGCGKQIGTDDYVLCQDGISSKIVAFHKRCNPADKDLKRTHVIGLDPIHFGMTGKDLAS